MTVGKIRSIRDKDPAYVGMAMVKGMETRLVPIISIGQKYVTVAIQGFGAIRVPSEDVINVV